MMRLPVSRRCGGLLQAILSVALLLPLSAFAQPQGDPVVPAVERLAQAIRIKTISYQDHTAIDYAAFEEMHRFLRVSYPRVYAQLSVERVSQYSLLITWPGRDTTLSPVLFTAHMDVVPVEAGTEQDWLYPAFEGVVADGNIYGRGTLDDKQGVLGLLEAAESLLEAGFAPQRTLVFAFGHDEEISGKSGAGKIAALLSQRQMHFAWMIDEGGMVITDNPLLPGKSVALVNVAEKGYLTLTLTAEGTGGHSSRPPKVSTIGRLSNALAKIEANPFPARLVPPVTTMLETMAPYQSLPMRWVFGNLWLTGSIVADEMGGDPMTNAFVRTTTALTMMNAGVKENVIPQRAQAKVNFRLLPGDSPEQVIARIRSIVDDPNIDIGYDNWDNMPAVASHEAEGFRIISDAVTSVYDDVVVTPSLLTATTDTRHYIDVADHQYRFHGMSMTAAQTSSIHGTNEYISIESYLRSIAVARRMLELAGG